MILFIITLVWMVLVIIASISPSLDTTSDGWVILWYNSKKNTRSFIKLYRK
jgi:hypothetical protein